MNYTREEVSELIRAKYEVKKLEKLIKDSNNSLTTYYARFVEICPHSEAIYYNPKIQGWGKWLICMSCGLEDHAIIGGTRGDEYDYGTAGHIDKVFWANSTLHEPIYNSDAKKYMKYHGWQVVDGKPKKGI